MELHIACETGDYERVKYLVEHGADVNAKNHKGKTALCHTFNVGLYEIMKYLLEHGADINAKDEVGFTALIRTCWYGNVPLMKYLVEKGADVNAKDKLGNTALHWVCGRKYISIMNDITKYLVEHGADVNAKNCKKRTPFHLACYNYQFVNVKYLVEHGADVYAKDGEGQTAIGWAIENSNQMLEYLRSIEDTRPIVYEEERTLPDDATEINSYVPIKKGDKMVDFNKEFSFGRYYYEESLKNLNGKNPFTREPIADITYYIVK